MRLTLCLATMVASPTATRAAPCRAAVEVCPQPSDPSAEWQFDLSVPVELGVTSRENSKFAWGLRPELLFAPHDVGFAIGPYAELARSSADTALGFGITTTYYTTYRIAASPSLGLYHRFGDQRQTGYAASLFLGFRSGGSPIDLPFGVRVDYRSEGHEVVVSAQLDLMALVVIYGLSQLHISPS